jgi:uncharacterized protein (DUF1800 family)
MVLRAPFVAVLALAMVACSVPAPRPAASAASVRVVPARPSWWLRPLPTPAPRIALPPSPLTEEQRILHVLGRLGYGPRPGDVERVKVMGLAAYIERQLDPAGIPDHAADQAVGRHPALGIETAGLVRAYPTGKVARERAAPGGPPEERRPHHVVAEMKSAKVMRAVLTERQLQEAMVDFWFNHFNVYAQKDAIRWMLPAYEREAIRPHALGRFRDLVVATARHPAMLFYLDNWMSTRQDDGPAGGPGQPRRAGLNENYARELLELHTLGVDGGYTEQDVVEVARCFTGWSIDKPYQGGGFVFRRGAHDPGEKRVLGHVIAAGGGESDGLAVIDILVRHPSTARFIASKLSRRLVSDDPPAAVVERAAAAFQRTGGDIRAVLAAIVTAPEFFSADAYRAKVKTPFDLVVASVRALGAEIAPPTGDPGRPTSGGAGGLARQVALLGEPLYEAQSPTGYPDTAQDWVNTGTLIGRMNFALALSHGRIPGVHVDVARAVGGARDDGADMLGSVVDRVLRGEVAPQTRQSLIGHAGAIGADMAAAGPGDADLRTLVGLALGSPDFQRR